MTHAPGCLCAACLRKREQTRVNVAAHRERQRAVKEQEAIKREPALSKDIRRHLALRPEFKQLTVGDVLAQLEIQNGKCFISGCMMTSPVSLRSDAMYIVMNDPIDQHTADNIRIVSHHTRIYVMDPGYSGTLDAFKAQLAKGLE